MSYDQDMSAQTGPSLKSRGRSFGCLLGQGTWVQSAGTVLIYIYIDMYVLICWTHSWGPSSHHTWCNLSEDNKRSVFQRGRTARSDSHLQSLNRWPSPEGGSLRLRNDISVGAPMHGPGSSTAVRSLFRHSVVHIVTCLNILRRTMLESVKSPGSQRWLT